MEILQTMGKRVQELRKEKGLTQKGMAEIMECTTSHFQKIEYGKVNIPATTVAFFADYFNVSTDYLLGRKDRRK